MNDNEVIEMIRERKYLPDYDIRENGRPLRRILYRLLDEGKIKSIRYDQRMGEENTITDCNIRQIIAQGDAVYVWYINDEDLPHTQNKNFKRICERCGRETFGLTDGLCDRCGDD